MAIKKSSKRYLSAQHLLFSYILNFFGGGAAVAERLGVTRQIVNLWLDAGGVPLSKLEWVSEKLRVEDPFLLGYIRAGFLDSSSFTARVKRCSMLNAKQKELVLDLYREGSIENVKEKRRQRSEEEAAHKDEGVTV